MSKLSVKKVASWNGPGLLGDGGGLYLSCRGPGRKSWLFIFRSKVTKSQRYLGLGSAGPFGVSLSEARDRAAAARALLRNGIDPVEQRKKEEAQQRALQIEVPTFGELADAYVKEHQSGWRSAKHRVQWVYSLTTLSAAIRPMPVDQISTQDILGVLKPLWQTVPETAQRLRGRIENVLDAAKVQGHRPTGGDVARWKGHLDRLLPKRQRLERNHLRALPFTRMPEFMAKLRTISSNNARMLEFLILTGVRSGEARGAQWREFDFDAAVWTIPGIRMKAGREHRIPLAPRALEIVQELKVQMIPGKQIVFPAPHGGTFSEAAMIYLVEHLGFQTDTTVHGFRSTFRDWCSETTNFPSDVAEMCLAHTIRNAAERAYRRGDMLERRRGLMICWEMHCAGVSLDGANSAIASLFNGLSAVYPHGFRSNVFQLRPVAA